jgi:hypothetical protein
MHTFTAAAIVTSIAMTAHAQDTSPVEPPDATKKTVTFENHGDTRTDHYYWLNDKTDHEVID